MKWNERQAWSAPPDEAGVPVHLLLASGETLYRSKGRAYPGCSGVVYCDNRDGWCTERVIGWAPKQKSNT